MEAALREAILNAIIHKDYSSTYTFLRVYDDRLHLWNPGALPDELTNQVVMPIAIRFLNPIPYFSKISE